MSATAAAVWGSSETRIVPSLVTQIEPQPVSPPGSIPYHAPYAGPPPTTRRSPLLPPKQKASDRVAAAEARLGGSRVRVEVRFLAEDGTYVGCGAGLEELRDDERGPGAASPSTPIVRMYGASTTGTTYSLPFEVVLTVLPPPPPPAPKSSSVFRRSAPPPLPPSPQEEAPERVILRKLQVSFEARAEYYDTATYSSLRIHRQVHQIPLPIDRPFLLDMSPPTPGAPDRTYVIPCDAFRLPGWLPATMVLYSTIITTSACVTAELFCSGGPLQGWWPSSSSSSGWWFSSSKRSSYAVATGQSSSASPSSSSRSSVVESGRTLFSKTPELPITIERVRVPRPLYEARVDERLFRNGFLLKHFTLKKDASDSPVDCIVTLPEFFSVDSQTIEFSLRIRNRAGWQPPGYTSSDPVPPSRVVKIEYQAHQVERYRSAPAASFLQTFPVSDEQPVASDPLAVRSPVAEVGESLKCFRPSPHKRNVRMPMFVGKANDNTAYVRYLIDDEGKLEPGDWLKFDLALVRARPGSKREPKVKRACATPFLKVTTDLNVRITTRNVAHELDTVISLAAPIRFVTAFAGPALPTPTGEPASASLGTASPYISPLPPYIHLFHESGTPREDLEVLPRYYAAIPTTASPSNASPSIPTSTSNRVSTTNSPSTRSTSRATAPPAVLSRLRSSSSALRVTPRSSPREHLEPGPSLHTSGDSSPRSIRRDEGALSTMREDDPSAHSTSLASSSPPPSPSLPISATSSSSSHGIVPSTTFSPSTPLFHRPFSGQNIPISLDSSLLPTSPAPIRQSSSRLVHLTTSSGGDNPGGLTTMARPSQAALYLRTPLVTSTAGGTLRTDRVGRQTASA